MLTKATKALPRKVILAVFALLLVLCGLAIYQIWSKSAADKPVAYNDPRNQKLLDAEPVEQILLFSFSVKNGLDKPFLLQNIQQFNGRPEKAKTELKKYSFSVTEDGSPVYLTFFPLSESHVEEFHEDGSITSVGTYAEDSFALRTPRFKDGSTFFIRDQQGTLLAEGVVSDVVVNNNTPDYKSVVGE